MLNQQLAIDAPSTTSQFHHHVSLLSSRSDSQRRESLAFLTSYLESAGRTSSLPTTVSSFLDKICPLILDGTNGVRAQLLKLLQALPPADIIDHVPKLLPHIRAGMTHLSKDIRLSSVDTLSWLIGSAGHETVSCPGGWYKTLECFITILGWRSVDVGRWTSSKSSLSGDSKSTAKIIIVLAEFLEAGLHQNRRRADINLLSESFPLWHTQFHKIPQKSNAYGYLNLFGAPPDEKNQMLENHDDRLLAFTNNFAGLVNGGIEASKKEGGELGRATGVLTKILERTMEDDSAD